MLVKTSSGHDRDGSPMVGHWFLNTGSTCCGLWTTPVDLARFAIEIQKSLRGEANKILSAETTRLMVTPQPPGFAGLGMAVQELEGAAYFTHTGGNPGFGCIVIASIDGAFGMAAMTNSSAGGTVYTELLRSIANEYRWKGLTEPEYESVEAAVAAMQELKSQEPDDPEVSEGNINRMGYSLLAAQEYETGLAIFRLNVEFYPTSANAYDSLAEAYMTTGDNDKAVEFYRKALAILDEHPEDNQRYQRLRESIPQRLEQLEQ
jgi:hypothetical protein